MIGTSLIKTGPLGMIGACPDKTRKRTGMISTSLIMNGPPGMIGAKSLQDPEEFGKCKFKH